MKFRKKPVVIEATQWFKNGDHPDDGAKGGPVVLPCIFARSYQACKECGCMFLQHGRMKTLEGVHIVCPGDWIITGVEGERYPCKPDIFNMTYDLLTLPLDKP